MSGESSEYFARGRIEFLAAALAKLQVTPARVMDYGCGTGIAAPLLRDLLHCPLIVGVDVSEKSLEVARRREPWAEFQLPQDGASPSSFDVVYCNGVFHHIPPPVRPEALSFIHDSLKPGGVFSLWENNPWNPGTQIVMRRIPFDRDAIKISAPHARKLLEAAGFEVLSIDFLFVFPRLLRALRPLEQHLTRMPIGAQYQVLARKVG